MADLLIRSIPIPVPRPQIEDIPVDPRIFFDKPVTHIPDIFSYTEKVGIERMKEQLSMILEPINQFFGWLDTTFHTQSRGQEDFLITLGFVLFLSGIAAVVILGLSKLVKFIFKGWKSWKGK